METIPETPKRVIYLAGRDGSIASVEVLKETEKQYRLNSRELRAVRGSRYFYLPTVIPKMSRKYNIFFDLRSAQEFVLGDMKSDLEGAQKRIIRLLNEIKEMEGILSASAPEVE